MSAVMLAATALLWGGGALMTAWQVGTVAAPVSVAYRMAAAGALLLAWAAARRQRLVLGPRDAPWITAQGTLFFGVAFIAFYQSVRFIPSGLAALVLSTSSVIAAFLAWCAFRAPLTARIIGGSLLGVIGVALIFGHDIARAQPGTPALLPGLAWALISTVATAGGTVIGARNHRRGLPVAVTLGWGAVIGAVFASGWALATGAAFTFDPSLHYVVSLVYLAIAASCFAFMLYFELVRRIGPGGAAYALALVPVIALLLSALFEGLAIDGWIVAGTLTILAGNAIVLRP
jgi:drug/metabolite transporter (DMT)-like permease